jgi:hypothetical protein
MKTSGRNKQAAEDLTKDRTVADEHAFGVFAAEFQKHTESSGRSTPCPAASASP